MLVARDTWAAVARHDIEISFRRMRPGILDVGGQRHGAPRLPCGVGDADVEQRQLRPDAGIEDGLCCHWLTPRTLGGCDRAGKEHGKGAAIDHGGSSDELLFVLAAMVARMARGRNPAIAISPSDMGTARA